MAKCCKYCNQTVEHSDVCTNCMKKLKLIRRLRAVGNDLKKLAGREIKTVWRF